MNIQYPKLPISGKKLPFIFGIFTKLSFFRNQNGVKFMPDGSIMENVHGGSHVAGIVAEFNPLHGGHLHLLKEIRRRLGPDTAVICCMSGDFVQRGDFALLRRQARARAAVGSGVDLVLELPLPWAVSSAEGFAEGGVRVLLGTGVVDTLCFGSERGDTSALWKTARVLLHPDFPLLLRKELSGGTAFPAARQRAVEILSDVPTGEILSQPNDILGVEYCKSLLRLGSSVRPMAVLRQGTGHGETRLREAALPSASAIRVLLRAGERETALLAMAPAMREQYEREEAAGRAPVFYETVERAIVYRLRSMDREEFAALDEGREGLSNRLYKASREASSVREILARAKTKRYPLSRLRRMVLWAFLGLRPEDRPAAPPYLHPLAMNATGRKLLSAMRRRAALPVLGKTKQARIPGAETLFSVETRSAALYTLAYPDLAAADAGMVRKEGFASLGKESP